MAKKITIIGCGPGGADYLTPLAKKAVNKVDTLAGAARLFDLFPEFTGKKITYRGTTAMLKSIEDIAGNIGILVSGDPAYFSLADSIIKHFGIENCEIITGISSIQVALSRFGLKATDTSIISTHAGAPDLCPTELSKKNNILLLGGNENSYSWIKKLLQATEHTHTPFICKDLTLPEESIKPISLENIAPSSTIGRTILVFITHTA